MIGDKIDTSRNTAPGVSQKPVKKCWNEKSTYHGVSSKIRSVNQFSF